MKMFEIFILADKTNEHLGVHHVITASDLRGAEEVTTDSISRLINDGWLIRQVQIKEVEK